ncbi:alpha/beta hydrolase [Mangrovimicrobium sediminis]|uniref:Alpha/beta hydrolase n=1 Tax=Mangrovimicrobium sediminis TaxID=2562682 RepID=A0A4Z0LVJ0_9GAMM|nr:alpha/beta hydrolase [Haliea sp. SAOS-164]TGD71290.1 alpha/beta hydrolase [Haliea sp. SAOS-164]
MPTDTDPVHPYYRAILDAYAEAGRPYFWQVDPVTAREMLRSSLAAAPPQSGLPELEKVWEEQVCGADADADVPVRRYRPQGDPLGVVLYCHSGGWVIGDLDTGDALCRRLAAGAGCEVVSVDYRLAPEHPCPAAQDDLWAVLQWARAELPGPILLAGESAGANLAAACAIRARDAGIALAGQYLAYPVTDHDFTTGSYRDVGGENYLLSEADMRWFWGHYCPDIAQRDQPLVSPLRVPDAAGLPPALVHVAQLDPLRDEGLAYAQRLAAAGVPVRTRCDSGMLHGYLAAAAAVPAAAQAVEEAAQWIGSCLRQA